MAENRRRHERTPVNEPATLEAGGEVFDATLQDVSESGAGVAFSLGRPDGKLDIGSAVRMTPDGGSSQHGRVVRHYEGGLGMMFGDTNDGGDDG